MDLGITEHARRPTAKRIRLRGDHDLNEQPRCRGPRADLGLPLLSSMRRSVSRSLMPAPMSSFFILRPVLGTVRPSGVFLGAAPFAMAHQRPASVEGHGRGGEWPIARGRMFT
jgi:hypothetical protein